MNGHAMAGDLLHLAAYMVSIVLWFYLWLIALFRSRGSSRRLLGLPVFPLCALGVPLLALATLGGAIWMFGLDDVIWSLVAFGFVLPLFGIRLVRSAQLC